MPAIYQHQLTVSPEEIDRFRHANNLAYLRWMLDAAVAHSAAQGWDGDRYDQLGAAFIVRAHRIEYLRPALEQDQVVVVTWVRSFRRASSVRKYKMFRASDNRVLATAATDWAFVRIDDGRPTRIPPDLATAFEVVEDDNPQVDLEL